jgi:hypothetical protein
MWRRRHSEVTLEAVTYLWRGVEGVERNRRRVHVLGSEDLMRDARSVLENAMRQEGFQMPEAEKGLES